MGDKRLLIIACSQSKRADVNPLPAVDRYDGPAFRVLRRFLTDSPAQAQNLVVWVFSAAYGLIPGDKPIEDYDQKMTNQRALRMQETIHQDLSRIGLYQYVDVCLAMSAMYLSALGAIEEVKSPATDIFMAGGSHGSRLTKLKRWLWGNTNAESASEPPLSLPGKVGKVQICGRNIELSTDEVINAARSALAQGDSEHSHFVSWYVNVDGAKVGVKWLVSKLVGLSVSQFTTTDAKRVLRRLGVVPERRI